MRTTYPADFLKSHEVLAREATEYLDLFHKTSTHIMHERTALPLLQRCVERSFVKSAGTALVDDYFVIARPWYAAEDVIRMLDRFVIDHAFPSWPVNRWISAMMRLFRPQIEALILHRDRRARPKMMRAFSSMTHTVGVVALAWVFALRKNWIRSSRKSSTTLSRTDFKRHSVCPSLKTVFLAHSISSSVSRRAAVFQMRHAAPSHLT